MCMKEHNVWDIHTKNDAWIQVYTKKSIHNIKMLKNSQDMHMKKSLK
jgi:hypothetical protein